MDGSMISRITQSKGSFDSSSSPSSPESAHRTLQDAEALLHQLIGQQALNVLIVLYYENGWSWQEIPPVKMAFAKSPPVKMAFAKSCNQITG